MSSKQGKLRVETVRKTVKGKVYSSVLLRRSFRKDGKVKHETVGNISHLPDNAIGVPLGRQLARQFADLLTIRPVSAAST